MFILQFPKMSLIAIGTNNIYIFFFFGGGVKKLKVFWAWLFTATEGKVSKLVELYKFI